jgi:hypothetical protein
VQRVASASLDPSGKPLSRLLPPDWQITLQAWFPTARSALRVGLGSSDVLVFDGSHIWHRVELTDQGLVVDGRHTGGSSLRASSVTFRAVHGAVKIRSLVIQRMRR